MTGTQKKTKIIATLGPASSSREVLVQLIKSGVDVMRINFSHADYQIVREQVALIRELNEELGKATSILADLQGPKLRIGVVKEDTFLHVGDVLTFTNEKIEGDAQRVYMSYDRFPQDVKVGETILVDDGKLVFEVLETNQLDTVKAKVIQGGQLSSKKGVNLPNTHVSLPALTEKDIEDAIFAISQEVDWMALSFVRHADDVRGLRTLIDQHSSWRIPIIAKIEKPEGVKNIEEVLDVADAVMVARGDLGVEVPMEQVPLIQKRLVRICKQKAKPVIIATQMMETMMNSLTPTRAEVNDVANSVIDGADAVMLSGETSVGKYPVEVVQTMAKILSRVENMSTSTKSMPEHSDSDVRYITDSICYSATRIAKKVAVKGIITLTFTGYTAFQISAYRPNAHIIVFSSNKRVLTMLNLLWGVRAFYYPLQKSTDETVSQVNALAVSSGLVDKGDLVINLNAMPVHEQGPTNTLRLSKL